MVEFTVDNFDLMKASNIIISKLEMLQKQVQVIWQWLNMPKAITMEPIEIMGKAEDFRAKMNPMPSHEEEKDSIANQIEKERKKRLGEENSTRSVR